ncbi:membrane protein [Bacteroidia bacterium]|nr:membrane protein [Bacteroidia bacterium]
MITIVPHSNEIYTVYGHSALHLSNPAQNLDAVLNWGTFNFHTPFFLYRFMKGETDYFLSYVTYEEFIEYSQKENITVIEQQLELSTEAKEQIFSLIIGNFLPENLYYRYDFLYDNCTTRIRDLIEKGTGHYLADPDTVGKVTYRELLHDCTKPYPWITFGLDLLIGSGADAPVTPRQELFLPMKLMDAVENSSLVISENQILTAQNRVETQPKFWQSPWAAGILLLLIYSTIIVFGIVKHRRFRGALAVLFLVAGLSGIIIAFTTLFSLHPCTSPNWNLLWLHPFHLIAFAGCLFKKSYRWVFWYHAVNFVILSALLIGWHGLPQQLNIADWPYILCLWIASGYWLYSVKRG